MSTNIKPRARSAPPILFIAAAAILFSTGGLFIKLTSLSAYELSSARSLVAAVAIWVIARVTGKRDGGDPRGFGLNRVTVAASVLYAVLLLLFVVANKLTTAANAIFLQYTAPVYILLLEPMVFKEKYRARDFIVVAACIAGMSLFFVGHLRPQDVSGNAAALVSGLCFAFFMLLLRHPQAREVNHASPVFYGNLILGAVTLPLLVAGAGRATWHDAFIVLYLGTIQIGAAYALFTTGMARGVRSLDASIVGYVEPVLNPLLVLLFIGERPSEWATLGGTIIIVSVLVHTLARHRRRTMETNSAPV